jgi:60 kDa SS-A/Ro ribonucleoprotein
MGITALIRNLGRMSSNGLIKPLSEGEKLAVSRLTDAEALKKGRVHPITLLSALKTYQQGRGDKGSMTWNVSQRVVDALNDAFYASFANIEPSGENYLLGIDCSGSMFGARCMGLNLSSAEAAAVMALATAKVEKNYFIAGFDTSISELKISPNMRLDQVLQIMQRFNWGGTDCAQPMLYAMKHQMNIDKFCVYTDNETWAGPVHPHHALRQYREWSGINAKLVVAGMTATDFSIADPKDSGMMDFVGFDASAPAIMSDFFRN